MSDRKCILPSPEQALKEREAIARLADRHPDESAHVLAKLIFTGTLKTAGNDGENADVKTIRDSGKPFYGILHVLRTLGR